MSRIACAAPGCPNHVPAGYIRYGNEVGLCAGCTKVWRKYGIALGGYVPVPTIDAIRLRVLDHVAPDKQSIAEALRFARGPRHRTGPWKDRPGYSKPRLKHGRWNVRLPELLLCRKAAPTLQALSRGFVHCVVADLTMDTGPRYSRWLAGVSFQPQTGSQFPTGRWGDIRKGQDRSPLYTFTTADFETLGTHALRACEKLGLVRGDRETLQVIAEAYHELVLEGPMHGYVEVPLYAGRSNIVTKHPLRHRLDAKAKVARSVVGKWRDQDGRIEGVWPVGIGLETKPPPPPPKPPPPPTPDTGWLFK